MGTGGARDSHGIAVAACGMDDPRMMSLQTSHEVFDVQCEGLEQSFGHDTDPVNK